jgi:hypothetical protein
MGLGILDGEAQDRHPSAGGASTSATTGHSAIYRDGRNLCRDRHRSRIAHRCWLAARQREGRVFPAAGPFAFPRYTLMPKARYGLQEVREGVF